MASSTPSVSSVGRSAKTAREKIKSAARGSEKTHVGKHTK